MDKLLAYLMARLKDEDGKTSYRDGLLNSYAYETGVSIRTLREYVDVLCSAGLISLGAYYNPTISLVK